MHCALRLAALLVACALPAIGCAAPSGDDVSEDGQALVVSKGELAQRAGRLAARLGKGSSTDRSLVRVPVVAADATESTVLPSKDAAIVGWVMLAVPEEGANASSARAYMLVPKGDAVPAGSFGLVLGDSATSVLATAVYVPDEAKDASGWAERLISAIPADAASSADRGAGGVRPQGLATNLAKGAVEVLAGLFRSAADDAAVRTAQAASASARAATLAEARVAKAETGDLWARFRNLASYSPARAELLHAHRERLTEVAKSVLSTKKEMVFFSSNAMSWGRLDEYKRLVTVLEKQVKSGSAIVVSLEDRFSLPAVTYALEHDIPVVVTGDIPKEGVMAVLTARLRYLEGDAAELAPLRDRFAVLIADPKRVARLQTIDTTSFRAALDEQATHIGYLNASGDARQEARRSGRDLLGLAPAWAIADRAVEARVSGGYLGFNEFIRQFARLDRVDMMPAGY